MTDLATLGLAVDSSQVRTASADLRNLESAAKRAGISVDEMRARVQKANDETGKTAPVVREVANRQADYSKSVDKVAKSLEAQYARLNMTGREFAVYQNLIKAGVTIQSEAGQKIATATRQIYDMEMAQKQLRAANDNTSSSFERMATRFMRGFIVGIAVQGIRDLTRALLAMNSALAAVGDSSKRVGISTGQFQQLQAVAGYKGISNSDLAGAAQELSANLNIGVKYSNDLSRLFSANNLSLKDSAGHAKDLVTVLANVADLVRNARTEQDKFRILQEAGIPATSQWLRLLEQGGVAFKMALEDAKRSGVEANDALIRKAQEFDDKWNKITTNLSMNIRGFFADAIDGFDRLSNSTGFKVVVAAWQLFQSVRAINSAMWGGGAPAGGAQSNTSGKSDALPRRTYTNQDRLNDSFKLINDSNAAVAGDRKTRLDQDEQRNLQIAQQKLALLGPLITAEQAQYQVELQIRQAARNDVHISTEQAAALKQLALAQFEMNRVNQQAQIGVFNLDAANKAAADTLRSWVDQKLLDPTNASQMAAAMNVLSKNTRDMADAASVAGSNLPSLQRALNDASDINKQLDQFASSSMNTLTTGLADIADGTKSVAQGFADLGKSILRMLTEAAIKAAIVAPLLRSVFGGISGGGGILGMLGLGGGLGGSSLNPLPGLTAADYGPGFASGGFTGAGARLQPAGIVHAGEFVFNQQATSRLGVGFLNAMHQNALRGYDGGGLVSPYAPASNVMPLRAPANSNYGGAPNISFGDTNLTIQGNVGPNEVEEIKRALADHRKEQQRLAAAMAAGFRQVPSTAVKAVSEHMKRAG